MKPRSHRRNLLWILALTLLVSATECMAFTLDVVKGFGTGSYAQGSEVFIESFPYDDTDPARSGLEPANANQPVRIFDRWVGDTETLADVYSARTSLTMPAADIVLTATYKASYRWGPPRFVAEIPPVHTGIIFMFHGAGGSARNMFANDEIQSFVAEALSRGFGVVALDSLDRFEKRWQESTSPVENADLQRAAAARHALIAEGRMGAEEPVYVLGASNGGTLVSLFDQSVQTALDFPVSAAAIYISSGNLTVMETTPVPTIFALAENDDATFPAEIAFDTLVRRGVPSQIWVNSPTPVHPGRFWRIDGLNLTDSESIYFALRTGGFLDNGDFLTGNPKTSGWEGVIPAEYGDFMKQIGDQLKAAYAEHGFMADLNDKVLDFFRNPTTQLELVPSVSGFDPASGVPGSSVTVFGDNFVAVDSVTIDGVPAEFTVVSGAQLRATVPLGAVTGPIAVNNSAGTGLSTDNFVVGGPTITDFYPLSGPPGMLITVYGEGFVNVTGVSVGVVPATIVGGNTYSLAFKVPLGATSAPITVTNDLGTTVSSSNFNVTGPSIESLDPASGLPGNIIAIKGEGFAAVDEVAFDGIPAEVVLATSSTLRVRVPDGAHSGPVSVRNYLGTAVSPVDFQVPSPIITAFDPVEGKAGDRVIISGDGFSGLIAVTFAGVEAEILATIGGTIWVSVPDGATTGPILVTTSAGTGVSSTNFRLLP